MGEASRRHIRAPCLFFENKDLFVRRAEVSPDEIAFRRILPLQLIVPRENDAAVERGSAVN